MARKACLRVIGLVLITKWLLYYIFNIKSGGWGVVLSYQKGPISPVSLVLGARNEKTVLKEYLVGVLARGVGVQRLGVTLIDL